MTGNLSFGRLFQRDAPLGGHFLAVVQDMIHRGLFDANDRSEGGLGAEKFFRPSQGFNADHAPKIDFPMDVSIGNPMKRTDRRFYKLPGMSKLGDRVREAREKAGLSQTQLAKRIGIEQPSLSAIETGGKVKGTKHLVAIARNTGVRAEWLESGEGPSEPVGNRSDMGAPNAQPAPSGDALNLRGLPNDFPVMGAAACGEDGRFEINQGEPIAHVRRPPRLIGVGDAYAVYICGDSMSPWREPGDLVFVHPHQPPKIGDYVLIQMKPENDGDSPAAYVKRLIGRTASHVKLLQFNPRKDFAIKTSQILTIHRVLDWPELMGF